MKKSHKRNEEYAKIRVDKTDGVIALKKKIKRLNKLGIKVRGKTLKEKRVEAEKVLERLLGI